LQLRAKATRTKRARESKAVHELSRYLFDLNGYARNVLRYEPWGGGVDAPEDEQGQTAILEAIALAYRKQFERRDFEAGLLAEADLRYYVPGEVIRNFFRIESGHGFGKTTVVATVVNHAFDTLPTVEGYAFATDWPALRDKTFKEVFKQRGGKGLPGTMLKGQLRLRRSPKHWIQARATSDAKGKGKERVHGLHAPFWLYVVDEADGVEKYVFEAINANTTGGIGVVVMIGNPKRRTSTFYRMRTDPRVWNFRFSSLTHPNVRAGREVIPGGAVARSWVRNMIEGDGSDEGHCSVVGFVPLEVEAQGWAAAERWAAEFRPDALTFAVDWYRLRDADGASRLPVLEPDDDFLYQVLGVPPIGGTTDTLIPWGRVELARKRGKGAVASDGVTPLEFVGDVLGAVGGSIDDPHRATIGVDVALYGDDKGTVYVRFRGRTWRFAAIQGQDANAYASAVVNAAKLCRELSLRPLPHPTRGEVVRELSTVVVRVDATGGYGAALVSKLVDMAGLEDVAPDWEVVEVNFGAAPRGTTPDGADAAQAYDNLVTQVYDAAGEALRELALGGPGFAAPEALDGDLAERRYTWRQRGRRNRKALAQKEAYRAEFQRSPDDGDGFGLANVPDDAVSHQRRHRPLDNRRRTARDRASETPGGTRRRGRLGGAR